VRLDHWVTLLRARAIENQACVIGVNRTGRDPNHEYPGRSMIIGPGGGVLAEAGSEECVLSAEIDPAVVVKARREFPALRDMR
jgi:predicted amidohydrolase